MNRSVLQPTSIMKTLLALVISLTLLCSAQATLLLEEHFSYANGNLGSVGTSGTAPDLGAYEYVP